MVERTTPFRSVKPGDESSNPIQSEMDRLIDSLDFEGLSRKLQDFAREKPVALAFAALTVGVAAGLLMRRSVESREASFSPDASVPH